MTEPTVDAAREALWDAIADGDGYGRQRAVVAFEAAIRAEYAGTRLDFNVERRKRRAIERRLTQAYGVYARSAEGAGSVQHPDVQQLVVAVADCLDGAALRWADREAAARAEHERQHADEMDACERQVWSAEAKLAALRERIEGLREHAQRQGTWGIEYGDDRFMADVLAALDATEAKR